MGTVITWIIVFAILCGCIFLWTYMLHRGPHAGEDEQENPSCDGDCLHCATNTRMAVHKPEECDKAEQSS